MQEAYVRVCQVEKLEDIKYPRAFLLRTAKNLALDYVKSAGVRLTEGMDEEELGLAAQGADTTYAQVAAREEFAMFCEAVRYLPEQCRRAFVLKKVYGYSQREIARFMEISESTVEKHIASGMKHCNSYLSGAFSDEKPKTGRKSDKANCGLEP